MNYHDKIVYVLYASFVIGLSMGYVLTNAIHYASR
jgi:hypothetical protein